MAPNAKSRRERRAADAPDRTPTRRKTAGSGVPAAPLEPALAPSTLESAKPEGHRPIRPERAWARSQASRGEPTPNDPIPSASMASAAARERRAAAREAWSAAGERWATAARERWSSASRRLSVGSRRWSALAARRWSVAMARVRGHGRLRAILDHDRWTWAVLGVAVISVAGIVAVAVATTIGTLDPPGPLPSTAVAAGALSAVAPAGVSVAAAETGFEETFDSLPMDSALATPWVVSGGDGATIVALPTSVDRSVRIRSAADGAPASACRPTGIDAGATVSIGLDVLVGGSPSAAVPLMTLESSGVRTLTIGLDPSRALVDLTQGTPPPAGATGSEGWRRIEVRIDPAQAALEWEARDVSGAPVAAGTAAIDPSTAVDQVCLFSPEGAPSSWIAVDDLIAQG
jgi:hypothetical protein